MTKHSRRDAIKRLTGLMALLHPRLPAIAKSSPPATDTRQGLLFAAAQKGRQFLAGLFDQNLELLPEYRGASIYWLFHDNYLAAKILNESHPQLAAKLRAAIKREGVASSGKIELLFEKQTLPVQFHHYELKDVRQIGDKQIRTEVTTPKPFEGWAAYADLQLIACIAASDQARSQTHWESAIRFWDGKGFFDAAAKSNQIYSTYKLALALIAAEKCHVKPLDGVLERLLSLQEQSGGWITDYDANGKSIGLANVETTCLSIMGIEATQASNQR